MKILIGCEFSGIVRSEFSKKNHNVWSCDLVPSELPGNHIQGDILEIIENEYWDVVIAFPPCTYRCNSGVQWLSKDPTRITKLHEADEFFLRIYNSGIKKICIENPIPHKYTRVPTYSQLIQPWMFGDLESKATCLWLRGLPLLIPHITVKPHGIRHSIHMMSPGKNRSRERSRTFKGIASAMASQWG